MVGGGGGVGVVAPASAPSIAAQLVEVAAAGQGVDDHRGKYHFQLMPSRLDVGPQVQVFATNRKVSGQRSLLLTNKEENKYKVRT